MTAQRSLWGAEISAVPAELIAVNAFPALKRRAIVRCPCGTKATISNLSADFDFNHLNYSLEFCPEQADKSFTPMKTTYPISSLLHQKKSALWSVTPETTVFDAIKVMAEKNIGALLVMNGDKLAGVFTERDYSRKIALHGKSSRDTRVAEIMTGSIMTISPDDCVEDGMKLMTEHRVRHLPVVEGAKVIGIISIGDLVNWIISMQSAEIEQLEQYIAGGVTT